LKQSTIELLRGLDPDALRAEIRKYRLMEYDRDEVSRSIVGACDVWLLPDFVAHRAK